MTEAGGKAVGSQENAAGHHDAWMGFLTELPRDPAIPLPGVDLQKLKTGTQTKTCSQRFPTATR